MQQTADPPTVLWSLRKNAAEVRLPAVDGHVQLQPARQELDSTLEALGALIDLDLYLTGSSCTANPRANCTLLDSGRQSTGNFERVSRSVSSGESLKLWVENFDGGRSTSYTISLTLTSDS